MNISRVCRFLGLIVLLFGLSMIAAVPWTIPLLGQTDCFDWRGFKALLESMACCGVVSAVLFYYGRNGKSEKQSSGDSPSFSKQEDTFDPVKMYEITEYANEQSATKPLLRREAIAVVVLGWALAGILGAMPFLFAHVQRSEKIPDNPYSANIVMNAADCIFESFSGVTGFGATVIDNVENKACIPRSILFWRSELHFLGGLGIMVLLVAILGGKSAGKSLMQTEMPHTPQESPYARVQKTALALLSVYLGLTAILSILLLLEGMSFYDSICHSFATIATGGFSTRNTSIGFFNNIWIEATIALFMLISSCNFTLLYYVSMFQPKKLFDNVEFRAYISIIFVAIVLVSGYCYWAKDFQNIFDCIRYCGFQVISIISTTGFSTYNYDGWNDFSRSIILLLIFIGGCVGSTACGFKIIRLIIIGKILRVEIERFFKPNVVRMIRLQGVPVENSDELRRSVLSYFSLYVFVFLCGCLTLMAVEPDSTWSKVGLDKNQKMVDTITSTATAMNCVGPSFGITNNTKNFGIFHSPAKILFSILMLLGRLEILVVFAICSPSFWKK